MSGFPMRRVLGKTGLQVSPLGIGGGSLISDEDLLYAFERGINYFFFSSDLHHRSYSHSVKALKSLCEQGSSVRHEVTLATVSYVNDPEKIMGVLYDQFAELRTDYIDVFHWGWVTDFYAIDKLFGVSTLLKDPGFAIRWKKLLEMEQTALEVNQELVNRGLARFVGASFHSRSAARRSIPLLDVLMLRYNILHTGIETDVLPFLVSDKSKAPGVVAFNTGHEGTFALNTPLPGVPQTSPPPSIPDCYRFALSNPKVDLLLMGPKNRLEIDEALKMLESGPMSAEEIAAIKDYGQNQRKNMSLAE